MLRRWLMSVIAAAFVASACASPPRRPVKLMPPAAPAKGAQCSISPPDKAEFLARMRADIFEAGTDEARFRSGKKYSFSFLDTNLREALLELSTAAGVPVVLDEAVSGSVSVEVKKAHFIDALRVILASGPYDFKYEGGFFFVGMTDQKGDDWRRLAYFHRHKTMNVTPSVAVKLLNPVFKSYVTADDTLGVVSVMAPRRHMMEILGSLFDVDVAPRQVLLKMNIAEITDKAFERLGHNTSNGSMFGAANSLAPVQPAFRSAVLGRESFSEFLSSVDFLAREGKADLRAQPKIIVMDGEKAKFENRISQVIRTDRYFVSGTGKSTVETGVFMTLSANIVSGDEVVLNIAEARSGDFDVADETKINESQIATKVRVREGDTLVLGGMITKKKRRVVSKVPWLGDIPYLGWLFKTRQEENSTVEVVFTISPEILCPRSDQKTPMPDLEIP